MALKKNTGTNEKNPNLKIDICQIRSYVDSDNNDDDVDDDDSNDDNVDSDNDDIDGSPQIEF